MSYSSKQSAAIAVQRGVTFGFYARNGVLGSEQARREVDRMAAHNVSHVVLAPTVMQETAHSTRQYRDFDVTPSDYELCRIIDYMHGKGMQVTLRPMLETQNGGGRLQVWFQPDGERMPGRVSDLWARWFDGMRLRSIHYARIAQETGCVRYGLDSELDRTIDQQEQWKDVIAAVREVYSGIVTSCHTTHCGLIDWEEQMRDPTHWWRELDELQMSCYEPGADGPDWTVEQMIEKLRPAKERFARIAEAYGKPISFGECGCSSSFCGAVSPSSWSGQGGYSPQEQANYLEAVLTLFWDEPWWAGIYWWKWDEHNVRPTFVNDPAGDKGFTVYGKPAAQVMRKWYGRRDRL